MATFPLLLTALSTSTRGVRLKAWAQVDQHHCNDKALQPYKSMHMFGHALRDTCMINCFSKKCTLKCLGTSPSGSFLDVNGKTDEKENASTYLFRMNIGGQVNVSIWRSKSKYIVLVRVPSLSEMASDHNLGLHWGISQFSSDLMNLDFQASSSGVCESSYAPFSLASAGHYEVELTFDLHQAPFYLSFLLFTSFDGINYSSIKTHRKTKFCVPIGMYSGHAFPFGTSYYNDRSVNFSLLSRNAGNVILCLYAAETEVEPAVEIELDPYINRTGDIWHVLIDNADCYVGYGYGCKRENLCGKRGRYQMQHILLDPYAKILLPISAAEEEFMPELKCLGKLCKEPYFNWMGEIRPCIPMEKLVIYRLNVGRFTNDKSSMLPDNIAGTFVGVIKKLQHLKSLGINAVLLEPIFAFTDKKGHYHPYHFFSPAISYGTKHDSESAVSSMKEMVKTLHTNGIEVLLEVIFSQPAGVGDVSCQTSYLEIVNSSYCMFGEEVSPGGIKTLSCNSPVVQQLILDSLRFWTVEFHIDGYVFLDAASLTRGLNGEHLSRPPLVEAIAFDTILSKSKIIADCWNPHVMSYEGICFPHWKRWAEMNQKFCWDVRNFLRGEGHLSHLATRFCGSGDIFSDGRSPAYSFNFVTRSFGLSLVDLVSYSCDISSELSWNCGDEGPTNRYIVLETRLKQIRNFLFVLYISLGIPVLNMGDECGQSADGSLSYTARKSFDWNLLRTPFAVQMIQFIAFLSELRIRRGDILQKSNFLKEENIEWRGNDHSPPNWKDPTCKFLAVTLKAEQDGTGDLFIAFNASEFSENITLPEIATGMRWTCLIDTCLAFPGFFSAEADPFVHLSTYELKPHSCTLFEARSTKLATAT